MGKYLYFLFALLLSYSFSNAQYIRCATSEVHKARLASDPQYSAYYENIGQKMQALIAQQNDERTSSSQSIITIPVVVHILWNAAEQDIPDAQVQSQIEVLNEDYSGMNANRTQVPPAFASVFGNVGLNFCLATRTPAGDWTTGIERKYTDSTSIGYGDSWIKLSSSGGLDAWDRAQYLNIWVCNLAPPYLGYTIMPGGLAYEDGCVVLYSAFGRGFSNLIPEYNLGRTATHEVGHWLGLFHTWGDDDGACTGSDYINDTPNQGNDTPDECNCYVPSYPYTDNCTTTAPGTMFMNYLDYTADPGMSMFSADQAAEMRGQFNSSNGFRYSVLSSNGCAAPTGIAEINAETFVGIYPNPASDVIHIDFRLPSSTVLSVTAYDMLGKKLIASDVNRTGQQNIDVDVSSLSAGLYMLVLTTDQGNIARRFSITR